MAHTTYIALLRGINVGGHTVKMERLRGLFGELGLERVRSYIQTGNVFFEIIAIIVAVGAGGTALRGLQDARRQLNSGSNQ